MTEDRNTLDSLAAGVADHAPVDWPIDRVDGSADGLVGQLRVIWAIGAARRAETTRGSSRWRLVLSACYALVLTLAALKVVFAVVGMPAAL